MKQSWTISSEAWADFARSFNESVDKGEYPLQWERVGYSRIPQPETVESVLTKIEESLMDEEE